MPKNDTTPKKRGRPRTPWRQCGLQLHPEHVAFLDRIASEIGAGRSAAVRLVLDHAMDEIMKAGERKGG